MTGTIFGTRRRPAARLLVAVLASVTLSLVSAGISSAGPSQQDLDAAKAKLAELNGRLDGLVEQFNAATLQLHAVEGRLADARTAAVLAQADATAARDLFGQRARLAYEGVGSGLDVVLGATTLSEFTDRLQFLNDVAQQDVDAAAQADATRVLAERASARLQQAIQDRQTVLDTLAARKAEIEGAIAGQQALVKQLAKELSRQAVQRMLSQPAPVPDPGGPGPTPNPTPPPPPPPPPPPSPGADTAVAAARSVIGVPYKYGGDNPKEGFDCSGLTMWAWAQGGVSLPHSSAAQYGAVPHVSKDALRPGDLLFFYQPISHVGMYIGNNQMIHATHPGGSVTLDTLTSYWWAVYSGAGRPG
jgi:cell wall-associated NlpC family hydrolase